MQLKFTAITTVATTAATATATAKLFMISKIVLPSRIRSVHPPSPLGKQLSNAFISSFQKVEQTLCVRSCEEFSIEFRVSSPSSFPFPSFRFVFLSPLLFFAFVCLVCLAFRVQTNLPDLTF